MLKKASQIEHTLNDLTHDSWVNKDSVEHLFGALKQWRSDLVEVPGNEEPDHEHSHGHDRIPEVTEEQMLAIQKELDERLSEIGKRVSIFRPERVGKDHMH